MLFALIFSFSTLVHANDASNIIEANHPEIQYSGRVDHSDTKAPILSWPGTIVKANFTGNALSIILEDDRGDNFFNVIIDGNREYPFVIDCEPGEHTYQVSYALDAGNHSVVLHKRTEGSEGETKFKGFILAENARLMMASKRSQRRIEIYGDSITSGMGNEAADNAPDHLISEKNQYLSYGGFVARNLNAEAHVISKSGIGVMVSWFDFIMPQYYDQLSAVGNNDSKWDFSKWTPDVVIINLFQNDCWLVDREKRLIPIPSEGKRIQAYLKFLTTIRMLYPEAYFVCALGSMDATDEGSAWPGYIQSAVEILKSEDSNARIDTFFFDFTGYGKHPRVKQHYENARKLSDFIAKKMNW